MNSRAVLGVTLYVIILHYVVTNITKYIIKVINITEGTFLLSNVTRYIAMVTNMLFCNIITSK